MGVLMGSHGSYGFLTVGGAQSQNNYTASPKHLFPAMSHTTTLSLKPSTGNSIKLKSTGFAGKAHKKTKYGLKSNPSDEQGLEHLEIRWTAETSNVLMRT